MNGAQLFSDTGGQIKTLVAPLFDGHQLLVEATAIKQRAWLR